ncbi:MAG: TatD family hydrolase [Planctomycetes bacterium]|nr:TatD family hydrolase [Planctomycetota bacterium]
MAIFDSHCHLYWDEDDIPVATLLDAAQQVAVTKFMCVGTNAVTSARCLEISEQFPQVIASLGIHPNDVGELDSLPSKLSEIRGMSADGRWHAIGETGLDFFHKRCDPAAQKQSFLFHLDLAAELKLPTIIHCRDAVKEMVEVLEERDQRVNGVMHCFSEGPEFVKRLLNLGLHFSFAGNLSYPNAQQIRDAACEIPLDRLLVETDAPFLAPQPKRGKKNQSAYIVHTLEALAKARSQSVDEIGKQIFANTERLFGFK